jgi:hypothetical protein
METLNTPFDIAILDRNSRYLENIGAELRPMVQSESDNTRLAESIIKASEEVFDVQLESGIADIQYQDIIRARIGTAEMFRILTTDSRDQIGQRLKVSGNTVSDYLAKSKKMLQTDIFYSAFVLASVIKAYGRFYRSAQIPQDARQIIYMAKRPDSRLPALFGR